MMRRTQRGRERESEGENLERKKNRPKDGRSRLFRCTRSLLPSSPQCRWSRGNKELDEPKLKEENSGNPTAFRLKSVWCVDCSEWKRESRQMKEERRGRDRRGRSDEENGMQLAKPIEPASRGGEFDGGRRREKNKGNQRSTGSRTTVSS
ncbi:uncharacterized protein BO97DRAFT_71743 [Aspergillus homomorphus CBS 101889]|uniref:Uncharacterized protein n=1 Tax=Aspergillus homomorphus (strain CBS 101889) TaxID=1450537 RepID=A0A395HXA7_ASPHC|nr:hypothetical protein BO97DRAFT_71743 [Aspergillus homomorphus CBS 101889]RAL12129.1 hypothetical protein BO97DRAFT_71743 [Aspergillus homomorphus CBS 101889]